MTSSGRTLVAWLNRRRQRRSLVYLGMIIPPLVPALIVFFRTCGSNDSQTSPNTVLQQFRYQDIKQCTEAEVDSNVKYIESNDGFVQLTNCPVESWLTEWRRQLPPQKEFTTIEIGCNKATDAVLSLKLFSREPSVDLYDWIQKMNLTSTFACPPEDKERYDELVHMLPTLNPIARYNHYCVEPVRETFEILGKVLEETGYEKYGLSMHQYAMTTTDNPRHVLFSPAVAGKEDVGIESALGNVTYKVRATSIDKFILEKNIERVDLLRIDTEGNDPRVLLGAARTLSVMKPSYVAFENHMYGGWAKFDLKDVIDYLDNLSYECYWATRYGTLVRITSCWSTKYDEWKGWSNIACVHRGDHMLFSIFMDYSTST